MMKQLNTPTCTFEEVFDAATPSTQTIRKTAMDKFKKDVLAAGVAYQEAVLYHCLADIVSMADPDDDERKLLSKAYDQGLVPQGSNGRRFYDKILSSSLNCAYCDIGVSYTLDHILPKTDINFPDFSVLPINLVPCCRDCNTDKMTWIPTCEDDSIVHPYFENFTDVEFLKVIVEIEPARPVTFKYEIDPASVYFARFNTQFRNLRLGNKYSLLAMSEFSECLNQYRLLYKSDPEELRKYCTNMYDSIASSNLCGWRAAFYKALIAEYPTYGALLV